MGRIVDWFDRRLGVKGFYREQVAFSLPESVSFWSLFGGLTIGCIAIQVITGFYMLWYYVPVPDLAHESIKAMANTTSVGALFRNAHRWSATFGMFFLIVHAFHVMAKRAYRPPRELNWWSGLFMGFLFTLLLITGIILPWDWRSYWELVIWADWLSYIPLAGGWMKNAMLGYFSLGRAFAFHIMLLPALLFAALALHIILLRALGLAERV